MNTEPKRVYWAMLRHNEWQFYIAATEIGLCCITLPNEDFERLKQWVEKHFSNAVLAHNHVEMSPYKHQLIEYFDGRRREFTCPLDLQGTPFQIQVWRTLTEIPFGQTESYSEIAKRIEHPTAVRAVGAANGANPIPIVVPCHRVIGKNGTPTGYRGGIEMKNDLLALEKQGIVGV